MKVCTGCGKELPLAEFVRDARRVEGHGAHCRACQSERVLAGKRGDRKPRFDPRVFHIGCRLCHEHPRNAYPGRKCRHRGAEQGALRLGRGEHWTFVPEGHPEFPTPPPWARRRSQSLAR